MTMVSEGDNTVEGESFKWVLGKLRGFIKYVGFLSEGLTFNSNVL